MVIDIGFVGHRTLLWSFRPSFQWLGATASRSTWNRLDGAHTNQHLHPVSPLYEKERKRERMNRRIASNGHDGVTIESWREREKEREIEGTRKWRKKRTMVWIRVKRDRKKGRWWGKGGMWQRWELYRPRRTAGLYPLSSLCPHHLALWNEHYTSRWRTVEEYPRYFSLSRSTSRFLLRFSSSFSLVLFLPFFPFCLSFFVFLSLLSLFSFLRVPLPLIRTTLASRFVFFSLPFLSFYIFSPVFSPIRLFSIQGFARRRLKPGWKKRREENEEWEEKRDRGRK